MQKQIKNSTGKPWYRYPMVWVLIFIPILTLIACGFTIYYAVSSSESSPHDSYYKSGLSPNELASKEQAALDLGLKASLIITNQHFLIDFNQAIDDETLKIKFQHPTLEKKDFYFNISRHEGNTKQFSILAPKNLSQNKWDIFVDSPSASWRVKGRLGIGEKQLELTPFGQ